MPKANVINTGNTKTQKTASRSRRNSRTRGNVNSSSRRKDCDFSGSRESLASGWSIRTSFASAIPQHSPRQTNEYVFERSLVSSERHELGVLSFDFGQQGRHRHADLGNSQSICFAALVQMVHRGKMYQRLIDQRLRNAEFDDLIRAE